jgi:hypothetical protein
MLSAIGNVRRYNDLKCLVYLPSSLTSASHPYSLPVSSAVAELDLSFKEHGIHHLLDFLSRSFHGGTDVDEPLARSLAKLTEAEWRNADILMVSATSTIFSCGASFGIFVACIAVVTYHLSVAITAGIRRLFRPTDRQHYGQHHFR